MPPTLNKNPNLKLWASGQTIWKSFCAVIQKLDLGRSGKRITCTRLEQRTFWFSNSLIRDNALTVHSLPRSRLSLVFRLREMTAADKSHCFLRVKLKEINEPLKMFSHRIYFRGRLFIKRFWWMKYFIIKRCIFRISLA